MLSWMNAYLNIIDNYLVRAYIFMSISWMCSLDKSTASLSLAIWAADWVAILINLVVFLSSQILWQNTIQHHLVYVSTYRTPADAIDRRSPICQTPYILEYLWQTSWTCSMLSSSAVECRTRNQVSPGSNPPLKIGHFRSLLWHPSCLSYTNEYPAIDSGRNVNDLVARNCCMARMLPGEAELVSEWTGLPGRAKSVKRNERSKKENSRWTYLITSLGLTASAWIGWLLS